MSITFAVRPTLNGRIVGNRVGAGVTFICVVEFDHDAGLIGRNDDVRDADWPAVIGRPKARAEIGVKGSVAADGVNVILAQWVHGEMVNSGVPDVVGREQWAGQAGTDGGSRRRRRRGRDSLFPGGSLDRPTGEEQDRYRQQYTRKRAGHEHAGHLAGRPGDSGCCAGSMIEFRRTSQNLSAFELDALRQWQIRRPVDRVSLTSHVGLPGVGAGFPPAAGLFFAAKYAADLRARCADVDVGDAAV